MYATHRSAQSAYRDNAVATASPARLLVMLVERLVLDAERALAAQRAEDWPEAHRHLLHAQDIVLELEHSLDVDRMPAGKQLASLYEFLRNRLVLANVRREPGLTAECLTLAQQLCDTWREAALAAAVS
ncbi:flagellar export chaperone FliS [Nocardioides nitrophenolicus]|uniref:flagellar export chaperone FliS n=1 Tax=Nocardioides nitrophenolicus TaxID=60489 RepID=UPI0019565DC9|nr:flagellar export chaperone FliS [Nocardioides nitrophenolicus]MBM7516392.1 flagellar protein FliS [Nocardioides nitrophenolicus]